MQYVLNPSARAASPPVLFDSKDYDDVAAYFDARPELGPTPLRRLSTLASRAGVGEILLKDESDRFGVNAFKIVGVSYAIDRLLRERPELKNAGRAVFSCATAGNHGRAVARVARERGVQARIYVPRYTVRSRIDAIAAEGAEVVVTRGNYDEAVREMARDAERDGWTVISDTAWPGYEEIPRWIMLGYTRILDEAARQWTPGAPPDVWFVQAGVGGLVGAAASWCVHRDGPRRPYLVACEPEEAACLLESARAGRPVTLSGALETIMAGLRAGAPSSVAWPVIARAFDAFVAIPDERAASTTRTLRALAQPVVSGPSGACGLAALLATLEDERLRPLRQAAALGPESRVFVINTEGATDPELDAEIVRQA